MTDVPAEWFDAKPAPEPAVEPVDRHVGPLDDDADRRFLAVGDPRRPFEAG
jgi:hypothetical protein